MSGIAAIIHFDDRPVDASHLRAMTDCMAFRGPDGISHWMNGPIGLGQCMLQTTAESRDANLPLLDDSGQVVLIMDGRIDNNDDLRRFLLERGARLRSRSDEELVLQAYLIFGGQCTDYLEGDFAIVIWDERLRSVFCLRDHFAHKAFHYSWNGTTLSIATEAGALLALPWVSDELNRLTIAEFVEAKWFSRDNSFWRDIRRLPAAYFLKCSKEKLTCEEYWRPDFAAPCPVRSEDELVELYRELLTSSVKRKCRSHKPIAIEVSGGLDSSAIYATAADLQKKNKLPAPNLHGYTLKIEGDEAANDLPYARSVARHTGTEIAEIPPALKSLEWYRRRVVERKDFMGYPNGFMNFGILENAVARGCVVLVDGVGGDEWLTGNSRLDYADAVIGGFGSSLRVCRADIGAFGAKHVLRQVLRYGLGSNLPAPVRSMLHPIISKRPDGGTHFPLVNDALLKKMIDQKEASSKGLYDLRRRGQLGLCSTLWDAYRSWVFEWNDRDVADHGMERRTPYNDKKIVELAFALPAWMFRKGRVEKYFHRQAMSGLLPADVLARQDKAVFSSILGHHFEGLCTRLLAEGHASEGLGVDQCRLEMACRQKRLDDIEKMDVSVRLWGIWGALNLDSAVILSLLGISISISISISIGCVTVLVRGKKFSSSSRKIS